MKNVDPFVYNPPEYKEGDDPMQGALTLIQKFTDLSHIQRYNFPEGGLRMLRRQNVAEHTANVTFISQVVCFQLGRSEAFTLAVMQRALLHDFEETFIGDVNHGVKAGNPKLEEALSLVAAERTIEFCEGLPARLRSLLVNLLTEPVPVMGQIVAFADKLDVALTLREECRLGNQTTLPFLGRVCDTLRGSELVRTAQSWRDSSRKRRNCDTRGTIQNGSGERRRPGSGEAEPWKGTDGDSDWYNGGTEPWGEIPEYRVGRSKRD